MEPPGAAAAGIGGAADLRMLLSTMDADTLVKAIRAAAVISKSTLRGESVSTVKARLQADGAPVAAADRLLALGRKRLLAVVRATVASMPEMRPRLIQELSDIVAADAGNAAAAERLPPVHGVPSGRGAYAGQRPAPFPDRAGLPPLPRGGAAASASSLPGRPPRPPGALGSTLPRLGQAASAGALPRLPPASRGANAPSSAASSSQGAPPSAESLVEAVRSGDTALVQSLLAARASPWGKVPDGTSAVGCALLQGTPADMLRLLLEARADAHGRDASQRTAAHLWCWTLPKSKGGLDEVGRKLALLAQHGADLNARMPPSGDAPLHLLARLFSMLCVREADGSQEDLGMRAGDAKKVAAATKARMQMLLLARAAPCQRNSAGQTPLDLVDQRFSSALLFLHQADPPDGSAPAEAPRPEHGAKGASLLKRCSGGAEIVKAAAMGAGAAAEAPMEPEPERPPELD